MKKQIFTVLTSLSCFVSGYSANLSDLVPREIAILVERDTKVMRVSTGKIQTKLIPEQDFLKQSVKNILNELQPTIMVENLYFYKKPLTKIGTNWTEKEQLKLFNGIRAISTLKGIEYYSASRKKMRTFYEESSVIENPEAKKPLPDPIVQSLPEESTLFARQKDLTFGDNIYRYDYKTNGYSIQFIQTNVTTLSYGIIPLVQKGNLKSLISIIDINEGLLLYAASFIKANTIPGVEGKIKDSFSNRSEAVYKWFVSKADPIFK